MIHVVLDTNIYRNNPKRDNLSFSALEKLSNAGRLKLHIPFVIEREFQTQQREIYKKDLEKAKSGLSGLLRRQLSAKLSKKLKRLKSKLEAESENILSDVELQFVEWAETIDANRHPLCIDQARDALEAYFHGFPPFKEPKIREDLPDSFIVQAIRSLCSENGNLHLVAGDKKILEAFSGDKTVTDYSDLSKFVESKIIQDELKDLDLVNNIKEVIFALQEYENDSDVISSIISNNIGETIQWKTINDPAIPDDNNEATISGYYDAEDIEINFSELAYYGNGQFGIPFSLKIVVSVFYYIFKSDYYCLENAPSVSDHNDHYFEAEDEFDVLVTGTVSITINRDKINLGKFSECIVSIAIDKIDTIELCWL